MLIAMIRSIYDHLMQTARETAGNNFGAKTSFLYQRSPVPSKRAAQMAARRLKAREEAMAEAAKGCRPLTSFFNVLPAPALASSDDTNDKETESTDLEGKGTRDTARKELVQKLKSKRAQLTGQNLTRHLAVLQFMNYAEQMKEKDQRESRAAMALTVARCFNRGKTFSEKLVSWERGWIRERQIPEGKQGCFSKSKSWFNDEGVMLAAREYLSEAGESR